RSGSAPRVPRGARGRAEPVGAPERRRGGESRSDHRRRRHQVEGAPRRHPGRGDRGRVLGQLRLSRHHPRRRDARGSRTRRVAEGQECQLLDRLSAPPHGLSHSQGPAVQPGHVPPGPGAHSVVVRSRGHRRSAPTVPPLRPGPPQAPLPRRELSEVEAGRARAAPYLGQRQRTGGPPRRRCARDVAVPRRRGRHGRRRRSRAGRVPRPVPGHGRLASCGQGVRETAQTTLRARDQGLPCQRRHLASSRRRRPRGTRLDHGRSGCRRQDRCSRS
ncbi:hypothetical protein LTR40_012925, partial [Exophiala xenobiotica]